MNRHPALRPFSREHHRALLFWRRLDLQLAKESESEAILAARALADYWFERFDHQIEAERRLCGDLLSPELRVRLRSDYKTLARDFAALRPGLEESGAFPRADWVALAARFRAHIRWMERVAFNYVQEHASEAALASIAAALRHEALSGATCKRPV